VAVGVVLGLILLVKAGGAGVDTSAKGPEIASGSNATTTSTTVATTTTVASELKAPQTVQVVAGNGSKVGGLAGKTSQFLAKNGYTQVVATDSLQPVTASVVYFNPGYQANAQQVAQLLNLQSSQVQALPSGATLTKNQPSTAGVVILIGPELANVVSSSGTSGSSGTTTTVAGSSGSSGVTTTTTRSGTSGSRTTTTLPTTTTTTG
jgi:hypothetical protein